MKRIAKFPEFFAPLLLALLLGVALACSAANAASKLPDVSPEGLRLMPNTKAAAVYMRDGAEFGGYDKVAIIDCYVAFKKDWKREQNSSRTFRIDDEDMTRIKTELAEEFKKVFSESLSAKGMKVVNAAGPGVLILRPSIINLDITAPDTMQPGMSRSFSASAGQMTLFLELYDGVTGDLLARVLDPQQATDYGYIRVRNSVTNRSDADRILKRWADTLGSYLERARSGNAN